MPLLNRRFLRGDLDQRGDLLADEPEDQRDVPVVEAEHLVFDLDLFVLDVQPDDLASHDQDGRDEHDQPFELPVLEQLTPVHTDQAPATGGEGVDQQVAVLEPAVLRVQPHEPQLQRGEQPGRREPEHELPTALPE